MELGQKLKQTRLEQGLSQRQLCGDAITRNMLSQIENGTAQPSMDTLRYLAGVLGKSMGYFLEEEAVTSPNQQIMARARQAFERQDWEGVPAILEQYIAPDPVFDWEMHYLSALSRLCLADKVLQEGKTAYAETLLAQAAPDGAQTPYYTRQLEQRRLLLLFAARPDRARELYRLLPPEPDRTLLLAAAQPDRAAAILDADPQDRPGWHLLRGDAYYHEKAYALARQHYEKAPQTRQTLEKLEVCCRELEDYKAAYDYACKLRDY